jgi:hypothetical protein
VTVDPYKAPEQPEATDDSAIWNRHVGSWWVIVGALVILCAVVWVILEVQFREYRAASERAAVASTRGIATLLKSGCHRQFPAVRPSGTTGVPAP